jgi:hypothetical protein
MKPYDHWWEPLAIIPPSPGHASYARLRHLWIDPTRSRPLDGARVQEFYLPSSETHLTAVLWEHFAAFPPASWLPSLTMAAGLTHLSRMPVACNWSYGWVCERPRRKIMDLVLHYREASGEEGILVVEAKNLGKGLSEKDADPGYYLGVTEFSGFPRRSQVYLLDAAVKNDVPNTVKTGAHDVGFLTWQQLGAIQITAAHALPATDELRHLVAGSIQKQYLGFGIIPTTLAASYLSSEPSRQAVDRQPPKVRQTSAERQRPLWHLDYLLPPSNGSA